MKERQVGGMDDEKNRKLMQVLKSAIIALLPSVSRNIQKDRKPAFC